MTRAFKSLTLAIQLLLLLATLLLCWFDPGNVIDRQRRAVFDYYQRLAPRPYQDAPVRIVDIDDASLARIGQWPWPRSAVAAMVTRLAQSGASSIAFDIVFAEPDRTSPSQALAVWAADGVPVDALRQSLSAVPDHDALLAKAIHDAGNVVTGFTLTMKQEGHAPAIRTGFATLGDDPVQFLPAYKGAVTNLPVIEEASAGNGSFSFNADSDLVVRRVPLVQRIGQQLYPTLSAEALRVAQGAHTILIKATGASGEYGFGNQRGIVGVKIGNTAIPTDAAGNVLLHYTDTAPRRTISAWQLFADNFDPAQVRGKIVLIGTSAPGLHDIRPSPINPVMPGVEAHAQALEQMLLGHYLERPDWAQAAEFCFVLVTGSLMIVLLRLLGAVWSGLAGAAAIAGAFAASWQAYLHSQMLFDPVTPSLAAFFVYMSSTIIGYLREEAEKRQVRGMMAQYMSSDLVEELIKDPSRLKLGGDLRVMSFLFCDVRGFTSISEQFKSNPQGLTRLLNHFLTPMTDIVMSKRGTIDKYIGDCVMAFWNAPLEDPDHAEHACRSALAMVDALTHINRRLETDARREHRVFHPLRIGVGLNTGECVVGNMGSDQRFDYSAIGDCVNLASRLEGQSKTYGVAIVVSEYTLAALQGWAAIEIDLIVVSGKQEEVRIYALLGDETMGSSETFAKLRARNAEMLDAYRERRWDDARAALAKCRPIEPRLAAFYELYFRRIAAFEITPPPDDWKGIHAADTK
ncbi:MAG TPA: adenylate/guanylate cyclase domain-containing protein [Rhizomicrobium sp.]|jgi:adenylate cyclase